MVVLAVSIAARLTFGLIDACLLNRKYLIILGIVFGSDGKWKSIFYFLHVLTWARSLFWARNLFYALRVFSAGTPLEMLYLLTCSLLPVWSHYSNLCVLYRLILFSVFEINRWLFLLLFLLSFYPTGWIYVLEMALKIYSFGFENYWRDGQNRFDFMVTWIIGNQIGK